MIILTGNADRGWNDPPVLLHTEGGVAPQVIQQPQKRTLLNKRVAFPVLGAGGTASNSPDSKPGSGSAPPAAGPLGRVFITAFYFQLFYKMY